jgi:hypothetical protein
MMVLHYLSLLSEALTDWLDRHRAMLFACFSVIYFSWECMLASVKPLWYDEIFTLNTAQFSSLSDLASRLVYDTHPPLYFLLVRGSLTLFGHSPLAIRLPAIVSCWVVFLCIYIFIGKRCPAVYAWLAILFLVTSDLRMYAIEGRPYSLLMACCGIALVCYQSVTDRDQRGLALWGLFFGLAGAISSHYYAILFWIPLGLAELLRSGMRKRLDFSVLAVLACGLLPLLLYWPVIKQAREFCNDYWTKPDDWRQILGAYETLLDHAIKPLIVTLILLAVYQERRAQLGESRRSAREGLRPHEFAVALGMILLPVIAFILGAWVTGAYHPRYVLLTVLGFSLLCPAIAYYRTRLAHSLALTLAGLFLAQCLSIQGRDYQYFVKRAYALREQCELLARASDQGKLIVVSDPLNFLQLSYHTAPAVAARLVYVCRRDAPIARALSIVHWWGPLNLMDWREFLLRAVLLNMPQFLTLGEDGKPLPPPEGQAFSIQTEKAHIRNRSADHSGFVRIRDHVLRCLSGQAISLVRVFSQPALCGQFGRAETWRPGHHFGSLCSERLHQELQPTPHPAPLPCKLLFDNRQLCRTARCTSTGASAAILSSLQHGILCRAQIPVLFFSSFEAPLLRDAVLSRCLKL